MHRLSDDVILLWDVCLQGPGRGRVYAQMIPAGKNGSKTFNGEYISV